MSTDRRFFSRYFLSSDGLASIQFKVTKERGWCVDAVVTVADEDGSGAVRFYFDEYMQDTPAERKEMIDALLRFGQDAATFVRETLEAVSGLEGEKEKQEKVDAEAYGEPEEL